MLKNLLVKIYKAPTIVFCYMFAAMLLLNVVGNKGFAVELKPGSSNNVLAENEYGVKNGYWSYSEGLADINGRVSAGGCTADYIINTLLPGHYLSATTIDTIISKGIISAEYDGLGYDELGVMPVLGGQGGGGSAATNPPKNDPPKHEHKYSEELTKVMTCTESGFYTYTCDCGESYTQEILPTGHEYEESDKVEPVCEIEGYTEYTCAKCGDAYQEPIAALEHHYLLTETKNPTCTEDGYEIYTCENCKEDKEETLAKSDHANREWKTAREQGFFLDGIEELTCKDCGEILETKIIPAKQDWRIWLGGFVGVIAIGTIVTVIAIKKRKK